MCKCGRWSARESSEQEATLSPLAVAGKDAVVRVKPTTILLTLAAFSCQPADSPARQETDPGTVVVTDSAGIEIVESVRAAWDGDGWRVAREPTVDRPNVGR